MKSNKDTNTMMKPINSLTNVSSRSSLGGMSRLLSLAVLLTFSLYGFCITFCPFLHRLKHLEKREIAVH